MYGITNLLLRKFTFTENQTFLRNFYTTKIWSHTVYVHVYIHTYIHTYVLTYIHSYIRMYAYIPLGQPCYDLHHHLSAHHHEALSQQAHHCEVHHLCPFVDHQPVIVTTGYRADQQLLSLNNQITFTIQS